MSEQRGGGGTPPGGGRWDHEWMREATQRPVDGPGSSDTLAASGGLELPARAVPPPSTPGTTAEEPIPGERDATTLTRRPPAAIGGSFSGADTPPAEPDALMDEATRRDRKIEGGGR